MDLSSAVMKQLREHAEREYPRECCGIIFESGKVHRCRNIALEAHQFELSAADQILLAESFDSPDPAIALYHSHPDAPALSSIRDQSGMRWNNQIIYSQL